MTAEDINKQLADYRQNKIKIYPCYNLRASMIGHPCERFLYLSIKNWEEKKPHNATLQAIFDLGNAIEVYAINILKDAGFEVLTPKESWKVENPLISGRQDLRIKEEDGQLYPIEIKGLASHEYEKLNGINDFLNHKKHYIQGYPAQLLIYMWKFGKEKGYFCLVNKTTGEIKLLQIQFDYNLVDKIFRKAERIYAAIKKNDCSELDTCEDGSACNECGLRHCCTAKINHAEADIDDGQIEELLKRKNEIKAMADEYGDINDSIKKIMGEREKVIAGEWIVTITKSERKPYTVQGGTTERLSVKKL